MNAFFSKRRNNPNGRDGKDKLGKHKTQRKPGQALPPLPAKADGNTAVYAKIATTVRPPPTRLMSARADTRIFLHFFFLSENRHGGRWVGLGGGARASPI